ncbi:cobalamin biosynthesis protein CobQ [Patescibacteria group bacterium]|nr:cobalamin biosynthesis protein CobQ [Patescibacteria group bacterium]
MKKAKLDLTIGWLYPELMSTYGDRGNIIVFEERCKQRDIKLNVLELDIGFSTNELEICDMLFMGGAQDVQQKIVSNDFTSAKIKVLKYRVENGTPGLYICGAYQFLGKYYKEANGTKIKGLGILDLYTEHSGEGEQRLIGNIVVKTTDGNIVVGFENHGGRTYLGKNLKPFGQVIKGYGNNGSDKIEGAVYKNSIGTYLHGPILPKNPQIGDFLIEKALERKYKKKIKLEKLDDSLSQKAREGVLREIAFL